jgi:hypothetical protein
MKAIIFSLAAAAVLGSSQGQLLAEDINQGILDDELFAQQPQQVAPAQPAAGLGQDENSILLHGDAAAIAEKVAGELLPSGALPPSGTLSLPSWPMPASPGEQDTVTTDQSLAPDEPFSD